MKTYTKTPALDKRCKQEKKLKDSKYNGRNNTPADYKSGKQQVYML